MESISVEMKSITEQNPSLLPVLLPQIGQRKTSVTTANEPVLAALIQMLSGWFLDPGFQGRGVGNGSRAAAAGSTHANHCLCPPGVYKVKS